MPSLSNLGTITTNPVDFTKNLVQFEWVPKAEESKEGPYMDFMAGESARKIEAEKRYERLVWAYEKFISYKEKGHIQSSKLQKKIADQLTAH